MRFALISDVHFGPLAYFGGKFRKLTHRAEALTTAFVERMNAVDHPELVINLRGSHHSLSRPPSRCLWGVSSSLRCTAWGSGIHRATESVRKVVLCVDQRRFKAANDCSHALSRL